MFRFTRCLICLLLATTPLAADAPLPDAEKMLGFKIGTDGKLAPWHKLLAYYRALAKASPRVKLLRLGKTVGGRQMIALAISTRANIANLEANRQATMRLADPRELTAQAEQALVAKTKMTVMISCNLHSNETASSLTAALLAGQLAGSESPLLRQIRRELVVLLVPSLNPDGTDIVHDWYQKVKGTRYERSGMPHLYQHYVGHDNNRDWYMLTQPETRHVTRLMYKQYFPQLVLDIHEMGNKGGRFFVPPFVDPVDPNIDPMLLRSIDLFGNHMALDLAKQGKRGVVQGVIFDSWWNGGMRNTPWRHNVIGILTEAARVNWASPVKIRKRQLRGHGRGMPDYQARYNFPDPWPGGWWRIGDIIEYQRIASISLLKLAAQLRQTFLSNYVALGRRAVARGKRGGPFAFVIPHDQHDQAATLRLRRVLLDGGVELHVALRDGKHYKQSDTVVLMAQPYRAHAKSLLERQRYPEIRLSRTGTPKRPYDISGWTLPLMLGVTAKQIDKPFETGALALYINPRPAPIDASAEGSEYLLPCRDSDSYKLVNRLLAAGVTVERYASGDFRVENTPANKQRLQQANRGLSRVTPRRAPTSSKPRKLTAPRLGLYKPHVSSMDEGWTRWVLDQAGFNYRSIDNAAMRAGGLRKSLDVLILPDLAPRTIRNGSRSKLPKPYAGGIGADGLAALVAFVEGGGTLICFNRACETAITQFELKLVNVLSRKNRPKDFVCPGSILRVTLDTRHPIGKGGLASAALVFANSPAFKANEGTVVARYDPREPALLSGYLTGGDVLKGKAAVVVVDRGKGRIVLFGCRPQFRGQPTATFKWIYNAIWMGR